MTTKPRPISISLESEVYGDEESAPLKIRLSSTLNPEGDKPVSDEEVTRAAAALRTTMLGTLKALTPQEPEIKPPVTYRGPTRSLEVLREVYTPRSPAHVDALLWEGEISQEERDSLMTSFRSKPSNAPSPPHAARPVEVLVHDLNLHELRDANRARFQRAITYDEWVSLKQHFVKGGPAEHS